MRRTAVLWLDMAELVNGGAVADNVLPTCIAAATCVALLPLAELLAPCMGLGSGVEGAAKGAILQSKLASGYVASRAIASATWRGINCMVTHTIAAVLQ